MGDGWLYLGLDLATAPITKQAVPWSSVCVRVSGLVTLSGDETIK